MPRPESVTDLSEQERSVTIGSLDIGNVSGDPACVRAYAALVEAVLALPGGEVEGTTNITLKRSKTERETEESLKQAQLAWEYQERRYDAIRAAELVGDIGILSPPYQEYEGYSLREFAKKEGLPVLPTIEKKVKTNA